MSNFQEILNNLLAALEKNEVSDLILSPGIIPAVRFCGELKYVGDRILNSDDIYQMIRFTMDDHQDKTYQDDLEIDYAYSVQGKSRYRINAFHTIRGCAATFRKIPNYIPDFEEVKAPEIIKEFADKKQGLILMVGPTGSGKSTTLASIIDYINKTKSNHIITIEDPVEFIYHSEKSVINQRQVGSSTNSFPIALKSALREDPDVIMVGEMRDLETVRLALTAAETGHLVISTLHTNNAYDAINRIIDVFPPDGKDLAQSLLSSSLIGVVSQRLLVAKEKNYRVPAHEILVATPAVKNLIREGNTAQIYSMMQVGSKYGMVTLKESMSILAEKGIIDKSQVEGFDGEVSDDHQKNLKPKAIEES